MASVSCPVPQPLSRDEARTALRKVQQDMPALSHAAHKREAARVAEVDQAAFGSALSE